MGLEAALALLGILVIRLTYYQSRLWKIQRMRRRYWEFINNSEASGIWLVEQTNTFKRMIAECDIEAPRAPRTQPIGLGQIVAFHAHPEEYLTASDLDIVSANNDMMLKIQGHYRTERNRTFSPLYWIEFILFLPREVVRYVGIGTDSIPVRLSQLAYWLFLLWSVVAWIIGKGSLLQVLEKLAR